MAKLNPRVRIQDVWPKFEYQFPMWFEDYVSISNSSLFVMKNKIHHWFHQRWSV